MGYTFYQNKMSLFVLFFKTTNKSKNSYYDKDGQGTQENYKYDLLRYRDCR